MKEMMQLMAKYNKEANAQMIAALDRLDEEALYKDMGLYYKSIIGTLAHYTMGDILFFKNYFAPLCANAPKGSKIEAMLEQDFSLKSEIIDNANNMFSAREEIDEYIIAVIDGLSDFGAMKTFAFPWGEMSKPLYQFVWGALNHATHHRGMIAATLDMLKVENDFNGALGV